MKVLIKHALIICSSSPFHGQVKDILVVDGIIERIDDEISGNAGEVIASDNLHISIGWMDIFVNFCDPGFEHKETIASGASAAAAGGFTDVMVVPNTSPAISSKSQVEYIIQKALSLSVNLHPLGAVTKNAEGKELSEMYDMHSSGAIAFTDGTDSVQSPGVLLKALQYVLAIEGTVIQLPGDKTIGNNGLVNEGIVSTQLGLPGRPAIAEELMIARDIELLKYTGSRLHITGVSTKKGVELISHAKESGLRLTCSVTPYHCFFCEEDLLTYDTNLKVDPPLRTRDDMYALLKAINEGIVDCITSHHMPQHWDDKTCEFEYAKNGMSGLESLFAVMNSLDIDLNKLVNLLTIAPREIFKIPVPQITLGSPACITLFDPSIKFVFDASMIRSRSANNAFIGKELKGRVIGIINKNKIAISNS
ncbi:MAG: dihydroorotase [Ferruginibacter sp.]